MGRFLPIGNQSVQKVLKRAKKNLSKNSVWVSKNAEFHADFESVEKSVEKIFQKKVISKNVTEKCTFFTFTHVRQTCFAYNFFLVHFFTILTLFDFFKKKF